MSPGEAKHFFERLMGLCLLMLVVIGPFVLCWLLIRAEQRHLSQIARWGRRTCPFCGNTYGQAHILRAIQDSDEERQRAMKENSFVRINFGVGVFVTCHKCHKQARLLPNEHL